VAMNAPFTIELELSVAWGEQDLFGHVNNIVYFRYFESVRMHYLERIGALRSHHEQGIGVILASTTCDFKKPVEWPQRLTVMTGTTQIGNTSFTLIYRIEDEGGTVVAEGTSVQVTYDYNARVKVPIPPAIRKAIEDLQRS
jgi:acyl-CoA thioester hydrolase